MNTELIEQIRQQLEALRTQGLYKEERVIDTMQGAHVAVHQGREVINLCANNYLGLAQHPDVRAAARRALDERGYGMASVRFICGTQDLHKQLEQRLADFLGFEDCILYPSCFDANGGLFETLLGPEDAVISDRLNHASIIDGIRLCKAQRYRYRNNDMADLEARLREARDRGARHILISTDGVFSMDGIIADLPRICDLAARYGALVHVDDSHATGFLGSHGRGSHEYHGCMGRIDITTGTLGKALGGAGGGYTCARRELVEWLRQRSRPYLFSNSLSPPVVAGTLKALDLLQDNPQLRQQLHHNALLFREGLSARGFELLPGEHPIVPVMLREAPVATEFARRMLNRGVYVVAFAYPVVPQGQARIRTQVSAAHSEHDLQQAIEAFSEVHREMGL